MVKTEYMNGNRVEHYDSLIELIGTFQESSSDRDLYLAHMGQQFLLNLALSSRPKDLSGYVIFRSSLNGSTDDSDVCFVSSHRFLDHQMNYSPRSSYHVLDLSKLEDIDVSMLKEIGEGESRLYQYMLESKLE